MLLVVVLYIVFLLSYPFFRLMRERARERPRPHSSKAGPRNELVWTEFAI